MTRSAHDDDGDDDDHVESSIDTGATVMLMGRSLAGETKARTGMPCVSQAAWQTLRISTNGLGWLRAPMTKFHDGDISSLMRFSRHHRTSLGLFSMLQLSRASMVHTIVANSS